jgi:hypothetical protein
VSSSTPVVKQWAAKHGETLRVAAIALAVAAGTFWLATSVWVPSKSHAARTAPATTAATKPVSILLASSHPPAGHFHPDATTIKSCTDPKTLNRCLAQAFGNIAYRRGPKFAIAYATRQTATNPDVLANCHIVMHGIGAATLLRDHFDVHKAYAQGSAFCASGYYHGILEHELIHEGGSVLKVARTICNGIGSTPFLHYQCTHGLGHGLMILYWYDLPQALHVCGELKVINDQVGCAGGVFMENLNSMYGVTSKYLRANDMAYPCDVVRWEFKSACYDQVTRRMLDKTHWNWHAVANFCNHIEHAFVLSCFDSYARDATVAVLYSTPALKRICNAASGVGRDECFTSSATDMIFDLGNGKKATRFCLAITARLRSRCFGAIGYIQKMYSVTPERLALACEKLSPVWARSCERATAS